MKAEPPRLQTCCFCCCCCCMPLLSLAETGTLHCLDTNLQLPVTSISTQLPATQNLSHLPKPKYQEPPFSLSRSLSLSRSTTTHSLRRCLLSSSNATSKLPNLPKNLCCSQMLSLLEICSHFQSSKVINAPLCCCCCYRCKTKKQRQRQQQLKRDLEMLGVYGIPANWVSERKSISKRSIRLGFFQNKILVSLVGSQ